MTITDLWRRLKQGRCAPGARSIGPAAALTAANGSTSVWRTTRHGSFLLIVVGSLALMSVFAVVYVLVGRADMSTGVSVSRSVTRDDVPRQFAAYASEIIADDMFSTFEDEDAVEGVKLRETWDYPSTGFDVTEKDFVPRGEGTDPWLAASEPTWLWFDPNETQIDDKKPYLDMRDWAHISNVAPDGRFVNLYNIRGDFNATAQEMRSDLRLLDKNGEADTQTDFGTAVSGNTSVGPVGLFSERQRGAFQPVHRGGSQPDAYEWDNEYMRLYQWADADGDGFLDSRWFEMVEARDTNVNNNVPRIESDGRYRYFFATRIVDLSGRVNLSTATDLARNPNSDPNDAQSYVPVGLYASDVDLRRLLVGTDMADQVTIGYDGLEIPIDPITGQQDNNNTTPRLGSNYSLYDQAMGINVGSWAYDAMYNATTGAMITGIAPAIPTKKSGAANTSFAFEGSAERAKRYRDVAGRGGLVEGSAGNLGMSAAFSSDDLLDLLAFRGVNDPSITSTVETIVGGRYRDANIANDTAKATVRYSPLRDNRPLPLERDGRDNYPLGSGNNPDGDGTVDDDAMIWSASDIRQRVTTLSGARPIRSTEPSTNALGDQLSDEDLKVEITDDVAVLFRAYAQGLVPYSAEDGTWPGSSSGATFNKKRTLNYGYTTPELGIIMAAHMAANAADGYDADIEPAKYTLLLNEESRDGDTGPFAGLNRDFQNFGDRTDPKPIADRDNKWAWWVDGRQLDLGSNAKNNPQRQVSPLGDSNEGDTLTMQRLNIYGIEPQPILIAAHAMHMYSDSGDGAENTDPPTPNYPFIRFDGPVTSANGEFMAQAVAFQITNPFSQDIDLSAYYFEFGGRHFRIPAGSLQAGQTRCYYALNRSKTQIESRWNSRDGNVNSSVQDWVNAQLSRGDGDTPVELVRFDPKSNSGIVSTFTNLLDSDDFSASGAVNPRLDRVRLWKRELATGGLPAETAATNVLENDRMVDVLVDPDAAGANQTSLTDSRIPGAFLETDVATDDRDDSQGYSLSVTFAVNYHRMPDPAGATLPAGAIPAYMIQTGHFTGGPDTTKVPDLGVVPFSPVAPPVNLTDADFDGDVPLEGDSSLAGLLGRQASGDIAQALLAEAVQKPESWTDGAMPANAASIAFTDLRTELNPLPLKSATTGAFDTRRVGDLLLPAAYGPSFDPDAPEFETQHVTLSESLALALGYESQQTVTEPFYQFGGSIASNPALRTDRGSLRIDAFVPFVDDDQDGLFTIGASSQDMRRGLAITPAAAIVEQFRSTPRSDTESFGSLDGPVFGLININTAPLSVLRCLPFFSPTTDTTFPAWGPTGLPAGADIAATVVAYRDKTRLQTRQAPVAGVTVSLHDLAPVKPNENELRNGRFEATLISGINEAPGFRSVGELINVRVTDVSLPGMSMDQLGLDSSNNSAQGIDSARVRMTDGTFINDGVVDEPEESLLLANAAMNSVSVRSDFFAVWFIVHGYKESDVSDLKDTAPIDKTSDPLVPSIARRFVMVVDRSTVKKFGDKPRIVLFREVPL